MSQTPRDTSSFSGQHRVPGTWFPTCSWRSLICPGCVSEAGVHAQRSSLQPLPRGATAHQRLRDRPPGHAVGPHPSQRGVGPVPAASASSGGQNSGHTQSYKPKSVFSGNRRADAPREHGWHMAGPSTAHAGLFRCRPAPLNQQGRTTLQPRRVDLSLGSGPRAGRWGLRTLLGPCRRCVPAHMAPQAGRGEEQNWGFLGQVPKRPVLLGDAPIPLSPGNHDASAPVPLGRSSGQPDFTRIQAL